MGGYDYGVNVRLGVWEVAQIDHQAKKLVLRKSWSAASGPDLFLDSFDLQPSFQTVIIDEGKSHETRIGVGLALKIIAQITEPDRDKFEVANWNLKPGECYSLSVPRECLDQFNVVTGT